MVTVYFVTNRRANRKTRPTDFTGEFSEGGPANLRFGLAEVYGDDLDQFSFELAAERLVRDEALVTLGAGTRLGSQRLMVGIRNKMAKHRRDTIVFVHGYNVSFRQALQSAAKLKQNLLPHSDGKGMNVVLFSWPSDGKMTPFLAYASDRQDAAASGPAFARGFLKLAEFMKGVTRKSECKESIHLLAHSMGNHVLRHAVQEISRQNPGRPPRVFNQVFLMAADEDDDAFEYEHKLLPLPRLAQRLNAYCNNYDRAMLISDKTKGNPDRLGDDGPRLPRSIPGKVTLIDCTPVVHGLVEHSYFIDSPRVVEDMLHVFAGEHPDKIAGREYAPDTNRYRLVNAERQPVARA